MFFHHSELAYTVRVDKPNPVFARMLQQAIGGPEGEPEVHAGAESTAPGAGAVAAFGRFTRGVVDKVTPG